MPVIEAAKVSIGASSPPINRARRSLHGLYDIWATPAANKNEVYFYAAKGTEIYGYVLYENKKVRSAYNKKDIKSKVVAVRVVHNPKSFVDDPDENTRLPSVLKGIDYFVSMED